MLYLMMTNILEESTELLCCGENAKEQVLEAFELPEIRKKFSGKVWYQERNR